MIVAGSRENELRPEEIWKEKGELVLPGNMLVRMTSYWSPLRMPVQSDTEILPETRWQVNVDWEVVKAGLKLETRLE